jgi:CO/xanthine dehydrogenase FAD-binding subunit
MRANPADYDLRAPARLDQALKLLSDGWRPMAGSTDLMVLLQAGQLRERRFVALWHLAELHGIESNDNELTIGALATFAEIAAHPVVRADFPALAAAAAQVGGAANRNRATIGGNVASASPAADSAPALLIYDAELELVSWRGRRRLPYQDFHLDYRKTALSRDQLIARVHLPRDKSGWHHYWRKVAARASQAITKVSLAAAARVENGRIDDIRVAYGAVAEIPLRCFEAEWALRGAALNALPAWPDELRPRDDFRSTAHYRRVVGRNLLREFLAELA